MLNHIWLGLIVIAIAVALGRDISELSTNRFHNAEAVTMAVRPGDLNAIGPNHFAGKALLLRTTLASRYGQSEIAALKADTLSLPVDFVTSTASQSSATATI